MTGGERTAHKVPLLAGPVNDIIACPSQAASRTRRPNPSPSSPPPPSTATSKRTKRACFFFFFELPACRINTPFL
jgi:hypothetical protein